VKPIIALLIIQTLQNALTVIIYFLSNTNQLECSCYNQTQQQYYVHTNLKDTFNHSPDKNVLDIIKM